MSGYGLAEVRGQDVQHIFQRGLAYGSAASYKDAMVGQFGGHKISGHGFHISPAASIKLSPSAGHEDSAAFSVNHLLDLEVMRGRADQYAVTTVYGSGLQQHSTFSTPQSALSSSCNRKLATPREHLKAEDGIDCTSSAAAAGAMEWARSRLQGLTESSNLDLEQGTQDSGPAGRLHQQQHGGGRSTPSVGKHQHLKNGDSNRKNIKGIICFTLYKSP